jgi:asparagine synthase (glutamine-hydrolysing)
MLPKVDRMSMANSLEVRAPFLDPDLFEASSKLKDEFLIKNGKGKYIIRELMKEYLPNVVFDHPKQGFSVPLHKYQNDVYHSLAKKLILKDSVLSNILDMKVVQDTVTTAINAQGNNQNQSIYRVSHQAWTFLSLFGWVKRFGVEIREA